MRIDILTIFPEMFDVLNHSIIARGIKKKLLEINIINIRDFSKDAHQKTDDTPFGGGAGMIMTPQPICDALESIVTNDSKIIYMSPRGKVFSQGMAKGLVNFEHLVIICGRYEGIDQRVLELFKIEEISIGDYVLTGGEIPAMVLVDTVSRLVEGVIKKESIECESFSNNLLEYDQYTRPAEFRGLSVPDVLLSGNHANIEKWRKENSIKNTKNNRPDLIKK